jgi:hypothetical protein
MLGWGFQFIVNHCETLFTLCLCLWICGLTPERALLFGVCVLGRVFFHSARFPQEDTLGDLLHIGKDVLCSIKPKSLLFWGQTHISGQDQYSP